MRERDKKVFKEAFGPCFSVCAFLCDLCYRPDFFEIYEDGVGEEGHVDEVGDDECWGDV